MPSTTEPVPNAMTEMLPLINKRQRKPRAENNRYKNEQRGPLLSEINPEKNNKEQDGDALRKQCIFPQLQGIAHRNRGSPKVGSADVGRIVLIDQGVETL